jgi:hypothetical protein
MMIQQIPHRRRLTIFQQLIKPRFVMIFNRVEQFQGQRTIGFLTEILKPVAHQSGKLGRMHLPLTATLGERLQLAFMQILKVMMLVLVAGGHGIPVIEQIVRQKHDLQYTGFILALLG